MGVMPALLVATHNPAKIKELTSFLKGLPVKLVSLRDMEITEDVMEDGKTYEENSQKKALFYAHLAGIPAISDDGGLEIDAYDGAPGIQSKRWIGHDATEEDLFAHMRKVARELPDDNRSAQFRTVVSFATPEGRVWSFEEVVRGVIAHKPFIDKFEGYPYRAFFYIPQIKKYYHEKGFTPQDMKVYNHRYKAAQKLIPIIRKELELSSWSASDRI